MKTSILCLTASFCGLLLGGCVIEDDGYYARRVTVYGDYDEYSPYYAYSGRRYYRTGNRYVYYTDSRPYYVTNLPYGARYITPIRRDRADVVVVTRRDTLRNSPDWPR